MCKECLSSPCRVGCPNAEDDSVFYCPKCGEEVDETVYKDTDGDIIGCDQCVLAVDLSDL